MARHVTSMCTTTTHKQWWTGTTPSDAVNCIYCRFSSWQWCKLTNKWKIIIPFPITFPAWWLQLHGSGCLSLRVGVWTPWAFKWRLHQGGELLANFCSKNQDIKDNKVLFFISRDSWAKQGRVQRMFTNAAGALLRGGSWCTMLTCSAPMLRLKSQICVGHT